MSTPLAQYQVATLDGHAIPGAVYDAPEDAIAACRARFGDGHFVLRSDGVAIHAQVEAHRAAKVKRWLEEHNETCIRVTMPMRAFWMASWRQLIRPPAARCRGWWQGD
jgi:hypothetical protein